MDLTSLFAVSGVADVYCLVASLHVSAVVHTGTYLCRIRSACLVGLTRPLTTTTTNITIADITRVKDSREEKADRCRHTRIEIGAA